MIVAMPRDSAIIFSDLIGKLDVLRVSCNKCGRDGCYGLHRLIERRGRDAKLIDWLDELTAECPKTPTFLFKRWRPRGFGSKWPSSSYSVEDVLLATGHP